MCLYIKKIDKIKRPSGRKNPEEPPGSEPWLGIVHNSWLILTVVFVVILHEIPQNSDKHLHQQTT